MKNIRIFISSPGDVQFERSIARNIIEELKVLYAKCINIEVLMWEDFPLSADTTFQEGINYFITNKPIDIAVFILWTRLGTPLATNFKKPDGSPYNSGTEYEFDLMMKLHDETSHPSRILTYVKQDDRYPGNLTYNELREMLRQKESLDCFLNEYFRDETTNSNYAYLAFGQNVSFDQVFRAHITNAIRDLVGEIGEIKEWEGNPYVGLNSFEFDQSSIFFGRKQQVYEVARRLVATDESYSALKNLILLGESGSGKSSFVKAGLLPFFCNRKDSSYKYVIVNPSMFAGRVYDGILSLLLDNFEFLNGHPFIEELRKGISEDTNFNYLSYELANNACKEDLIIYIDQLEELFSDVQITEEERNKVILLLRGFVKMRNISIFMSMRSDFYGCFSLYKGMSQIKDDCEVIDIPVMGISEIAEIIEAPARKACLKWEINNVGVSLNSRIVHDANLIHDLPLIEFALSELYEMRNERDMLTWNAYEQMGGLRGAIINYANKCYAQLDDEQKSAFRDILGFVVAESQTQSGTYVRKTSLREDVDKSPLHRVVVDKMLSARLFVSGKDYNKRPTITIAHEILLRSWDVVANWIESEKDFIANNNHYEQLSLHWSSGGKRDNDLISGKSLILESEYFHFKNSNRISDRVLDFLNASFKKYKGSGVAWRLLLCILFLYLICDIILSSDPIFTFNSKIAQICFITSNVVCLLLSAYSIYTKLRGRPEYQTIKRSVCVWTIAAVASTLLLIPALMSDDDSILFVLLIYQLPIVIYLTSYIWELIRRKRWSKHYVAYVFSDGFRSQSKAVLYTTCIFAVFIITVGITSNEYIEEMEGRAKVTDELFERLNNLKGILEYPDNRDINNLRKKYLNDYFSGELNDNHVDSIDFQYARTLYNLKVPNRALDHLYPDLNSEHRLFWIVCAFCSGQYDLATTRLQEYVDSCGFDVIDRHITSANLMWYAELMGRFDCAAKLDTIIRNVNLNFDKAPRNIIRRAHIDLYNEKVDSAIFKYKSVLNVAENAYGDIGRHTNNPLKYFIKHDLHILSRFGVIPDNVLKDVAKELNVDFIPAYVPKEYANTALSDSLKMSMAGNWVCQDQNLTIKLNIDCSTGMFTRILIDDKGAEFDKRNSECRIAKIDSVQYGYQWDEYYPENNVNTQSKMISINIDSFELEEIDNGNSHDRDKKYIYTRVKDSDIDNTTIQTK